MPTIDWLRQEFGYGYDSGNVTTLIPSIVRYKEEKRIGGSYRKAFKAAVLPYIAPSSTVLELGPGKGSWSRAILNAIPKGILHTVDFQDVGNWLHPERYSGRLVCHQVHDNAYSILENNFFDFFWSMGVLCHNNEEHIEEILSNVLPKLKPGAFSVHQYSDWEKLDKYGWKRGGIPTEFKHLPDQEIWWPRNTAKNMTQIAQRSGWVVVSPDLGLFKRDSVILLQKP